MSTAESAGSSASTVCIEEAIEYKLGGEVRLPLPDSLTLSRASSLASKITLSRRPEKRTCSSIVNCFRWSLSGNWRNHWASAFETSIDRAFFRCRRPAEPRRLLELRLKPGPDGRFRIFLGLELRDGDPVDVGVATWACASRSLSCVEKYCWQGISPLYK